MRSYGAGSGLAAADVTSAVLAIGHPDFPKVLIDTLRRQAGVGHCMAGGPGNPLGARAMYLGETEYRIHGTNNPDTIGKRVSSGCIRLTNDDVVDLYERVKVGAKVIVLPATVARRPSQGAPTDAAFRLPDPASPSKRPLAANAQMLSSGPKIAEAQ